MNPEKQKLIDSKNQILQEISDLDKQLGNLGFNQDLTQVSRMSYLTKPPRMSKGDNFVHYCEKFQGYVQMTGLNQNLDLLFLQNIDSYTYTSLKSAAAALTVEEKSDAKLMCKQFQNALFGDETVSLRNSLLNMQQKPDEPVVDFCNRIQEASSMAYNSPEQADDASLLTLLRGVANRSLRQKLNEATLTTFRDAVRLAKKLESVKVMFETENEPSTTPILKTSNTPSYSSSKDSRSHSRGDRHHSSRSSHRRNRRHSRSRSRSRDRRRSRRTSLSRKQNDSCWNCHKKGHHRSECPHLN